MRPSAPRLCSCEADVHPCQPHIALGFYAALRCPEILRRHAQWLHFCRWQHQVLGLASLLVAEHRRLVKLFAARRAVTVRLPALPVANRNRLPRHLGEPA